MAKELLIYSPLYDFTAETVVKQLNNVSNDEELTVRLNSPGGHVTAGWSIISKLIERTGTTKAIIDGEAASMSAIMLMFFDEVVANDTSSIMFHKAAYPSWYKPNDSEKEQLKKINDQFKQKLSKKVEGKPNSKEFLNKVFEPDTRNDVSLTPLEAKDLGIVKEIRKLEPKAYEQMQIVAMFNEGEIPINSNKPPQRTEDINNLKDESMDLAKLKAEHPALYAQVLAEGDKTGYERGVKAEKDRVEAWAVYNEIDPEKVKTGIESGEPLTAKAMAEFNLQAVSGKKLDAIEGENPEDPKPGTEAKTEAEIQAEKDNALLDEAFGTKPKSE